MKYLSFILCGLVWWAGLTAAEAHAATGNEPAGSESRQQDVVWHNPQTGATSVSYIQNQGWNEDGGNYRRLPLRAKDRVREAVWSLSGESAGLAVRFRTDASDIRVKYKVTGGYSMLHMPSTGVSGVDLYRVSDGAFCFGSYSFGDTIAYRYGIDRPSSLAEEEYVLYLPLYNGVTHLEIGVTQGHTFSFVPASDAAPVVLYGTSIAQGACASRPGMAWGNILSRSLGVPLVNLGFSGNGKLEKEVIDFLNELNARVYILDCLPNLGDLKEEDLKERVKAAVRQIRAVHDTPILLVEHAGYSNGNSNQGRYDTYERTNRAQAAAFRELKREGVTRLHYLTREELGFHPDSWVDYVHPSDYGMVQQARAVGKKLSKLLK